MVSRAISNETYPRDFRTPHRDHPSRRQAEQARLAVEALFQTQQPRREDTADVDVVVKRRRVALTDNLIDGN
jgi:hypothetical protein